MAAQSSAHMLAGGIAERPSHRKRELPTLSAVLLEQFKVFGGEATMAKPLIMAVPGILVTVYIIEPAAWLGLPVWLGLSFGLAFSSQRIQGRGMGWELPVHRTTHNILRNAAGLGWMLAASLVLTPLLFLLAGEPLNGGVIPAVVMASSWAIIPFSVAATFSQLVNRARIFLIPLSLLLLMPLMVVPSRAIQAMLPDFLDPVVDGRYGLDTFSGRMLMRGGIAAPTWDPGTWLISAAIWLACALSVLCLLVSSHQE